MTAIDVVMPAAVADPARPSGGNHYDRRVCQRLTARGHVLREHLVASPRDVGAVLDAVPDGGTALLDGLLTPGYEAARASGRRHRLAVLLHMPVRADRPDQEEGRTLRCVDAVVTTSPWTRDFLLRAYRLDPRHVVVAEPGVDQGDVATPSAGGGRLLCVGALARHKGQDCLVAALAQLADLPWRLVCAGSHEIEPAYAAAIRREVAARGLADRVSLPGALGEQALDAAYRECDLVVSASEFETYGMALTEALSHGVPVLATDVGGVRHALGATAGHEPPGILVPPRSPTAVADALRRWLTDPALRRRLRRAALARRQALPTWDVTARAIEAALLGTAA